MKLKDLEKIIFSKVARGRIDEVNIELFRQIYWTSEVAWGNFHLLVKPKKSVHTSFRPGGIDLRNFFAMKMSPPQTVRKNILNRIIETKLRMEIFSGASLTLNDSFLNCMVCIVCARSADYWKDFILLNSLYYPKIRKTLQRERRGSSIILSCIYLNMIDISL